MIPTLYRGSVKDLLGPLQTENGPGLVFEYTDAYSVFDWGRMPDPLPGKGSALAVTAAHWFEKLEQPETWSQFSKTPEALALRKANRFGADFNEWGERLQREGLRTHYSGCLIGSEFQKLSTGTAQARGARLAEISRGEVPRHLLVKQVSVQKPRMTSLLGRAVPDYSSSWNAPSPKLVPLEVVFRFSCPPGSSLVDRLRQDSQYLASRGFSDVTVESIEKGARWDFPVLELFTKLESSDRPVSLGEALAICGLPAERLNELLFKTAWVASLLRANLAKSGLELADGKLEWGVMSAPAGGQCFLVDAIGPDELRILKDGVQLSKEFLRAYYRGTPWYESLNQAKHQATATGTADWKRLVPLGPSHLPAQQRELATQLYLSLANAMTGRDWFPDAWSISRVADALRAAAAAPAASPHKGATS